jgi:phospholipid transport system substrate-binding protein
MKLFILAPLLFILSWCLVATPARAEEGPGTAAVRKANATVTALLQQKPAPGSDAEKRLAAEVSAQLKGFLDIDELGQRALADHWKDLTAAQRKQFLTLLRELVEANYVKALRSNLQYDVRYLAEAENDGARLVSTELRFERNGRPETIGVDYKLQNARGAWRAFDLVTDGVGLVENYRAQFNQIFAKEGFSGLIERMKKKKKAQSSS